MYDGTGAPAHGRVEVREDRIVEVGAVRRAESRSWMPRASRSRPASSTCTATTTSPSCLIPRCRSRSCRESPPMSSATRLRRGPSRRGSPAFAACTRRRPGAVARLCRVSRARRRGVAEPQRGRADGPRDSGAARWARPACARGRRVGRMRAWVREGVAAGANGLSTGLIYEPGRYARTEEIVTLRGSWAGRRRALRDAHAKRGRRAA